MAEKSAFLTCAWGAALQEEAQRLLDRRPGGDVASFSYIAHFTNAPDPGTVEQRPGYRMDIVNGKVRVRLGIDERERANAMLVMDHDAAHATLTVRSGPEMDDLARLAFDQGKRRLDGSYDAMPLDLSALHDAMLERTSVIIPLGSPPRRNGEEALHADADGAVPDA
ncbi:MAG: hypothetical protein EOP61_18980 [Sphingomonadales bacterium]|nr:MAG: hypothetical protein EOP61_18980 [Sphingomonadales bacterium]